MGEYTRLFLGNGLANMFLLLGSRKSWTTTMETGVCYVTHAKML
jgi:hypothetical protein